MRTVRVGTAVARVFAVLTTAAWLVSVWSTPAAAACGVSYQGGDNPFQGCSPSTSTAAAAIVATAAVTVMAATALLAFRRGMLSPTELVTVLRALRVPMTSQTALPAGRANPTLPRVRRLPRAAKGAGGEAWARQVYGSGPETPYIAPDAAPGFPIDSATHLRKVDTTAEGQFGVTDAMEIKTYARWRTTWDDAGNMTATRVSVELTNEIRNEIAKDVALRGPLYNPVWLFLDSGPSDTLRAHLIEAGIRFIEYDRG
jgi:hypothetical protein